jgi:hypothetical protein
MDRNCEIKRIECRKVPYTNQFRRNKSHSQSGLTPERQPRDHHQTKEHSTRDPARPAPLLDPIRSHRISRHESSFSPLYRGGTEPASPAPIPSHFDQLQYVYRLRSNHPLDPAMATDWSITHSPTPRYLSTHVDTSLFSPATLSVLKLEGWKITAVS